MGDAFGELFFTYASLVEARTLSRSPWDFTDDTIMTMSVVDVLAEKSAIDQNLLADLLALRLATEPK